MKIRAVIIDDDSEVHQMLTTMVQRSFPDIEIVGSFLDIESGYEQTKKIKPNLVFLDLNLPRGSGVNFLERFPFRKFEVIVVSGYPEKKHELNRFAAISFIPKPFDTDVFENVTLQVVNNIRENPHKVHRSYWDPKTDSDQ